jgi:nucleoside-diphosphate-sugar epimerase
MPHAKPSVLVTGANGFVGARLCHKLLLEGFEVIAGVRKTSDCRPLQALNVSYRFGDVTEAATLGGMVDGADFVIHNAGVVKARRRETFTRVNVEGTRALMEALAERNPSVRRVVYISSMAAAGPSIDGAPVEESDQPHPVTAYGVSKLAGEEAALGYTARFEVVALRPSGVYGPGDKELFSLFQTVHKGFRPRIGNMQRKLQLVHVDDLARAVFLALTGPAQSGQTYNIAENQTYTMDELIAQVAEGVGRKGIPLSIPGPIFKGLAAISEAVFRMVGAAPMLTREKAGELLASWEISTAKARREIGFESCIPLRQGVRETYQWYLREGWLR